MTTCKLPRCARLESRGGYPNEVLSAHQLRVFLNQLLQAEARKLYSNLGFFAFSFSLVDGSFAVFGMANFLAGAEATHAGGRFQRNFRDGKLLAATGKKLGYVLDGVVGLGWSRGLLAGCRDAVVLPACALVFVFVGVVSIGGIVGCGATPRWTGKSARPHTIGPHIGHAAAA